MTVKNLGEKYRCNICGNEVLVTKVGGGTLVCCGEEMGLITESAPNNSEGMLMDEDLEEMPEETPEEMDEELGEHRNF